MPKDPSIRRRTNRQVTHAKLPSVEVAALNKVPELYARAATENWHPRVLAWWNAMWRSPMATEWLESDVVGVVYRTAEMQQDFWTAKESAGRVAVETRIAKNEERLGLSPIDRRRLQWEIEKGDEAHERTQKRRTQKELVKATSGKDPRDLIKAVG